MIDHYSSWLKQPMVSIDVETTGLDHKNERVVELGLVRIEGGVVVEKWSSLLNPGKPIPREVSNIHGNFDRDVEGQPKFVHVMESALRILRDAIPVAYNADFDQKFIWAEAYRCGIYNTLSHIPALDPNFPWIDPMVWSRHFHGNNGRGENTLGRSCERHGISIKDAHRAGDDAEACGKLLLAMSEKIGIEQTFGQIIMRQRDIKATRGARRQ